MSIIGWPVRLAATAVTSLALIAACGGDDDASTSPGDADTSPENGTSALDDSEGGPCLVGEWVMNNQDASDFRSAQDASYDWEVSGTLSLLLTDDGEATWNLNGLTYTSIGLPAGPDPGEESSITTTGSGTQSYSTGLGGLLSFSGPPISVTVTETAHDEVIETTLPTGLGGRPGDTDYFYECEGDTLTLGLAGANIRWDRVQ